MLKRSKAMFAANVVFKLSIVKLAQKDGKDILYQILEVKLGVRLIRGCDLYAEFYGISPMFSISSFFSPKNSW